MEKDFYTDDFEQLLKDTTEDFRMYPSRKVWHSIYNDLHPAKKWPSFAVCLLLITAILYLGINNNNTINADAENLMVSTLAGTENKESVPNVDKSSTTGDQNPDKSMLGFNSAPAGKQASHTPAGIDAATPVIEMTYPAPTASTPLPIPALALEEKDLVSPSKEKELKSQVFINITVPLPETVEISSPEKNITVLPGVEQSAISRKISSRPVSDNSSEENNPTVNVTDNAGTNPTPIVETSSPELKKTKTEDKVWMEDFAFHNKKAGNKWKTRFSTLVYLTPSVGYRILNKNNNFEPVNALLIRSSATSVDADDAISQQAALNLESGATAILDITRKLRVKAGVQFNYTNYISFAERLSHPTQTNVLLNDLGTGNTMLFPFSTSFGNQGTDNRARLNNKTAQFSIPIGADYKLAGNDKIKWYIGATIQPTYVAGGTAYLVSSDYKNYVEVPSMLRTWNLNAGFESMVSYKTKGGSVINIGPQFRYQLLSTYSKRYTYTENLYNVGVKFGITRKF
jgi:hypothetical protein